MISAKRKPLSFLPIVLDDYDADTAHLEALQHGAYLLTLMRYYRRQKPLLEIEVRRASLLSESDWEANRDVLAAFFVVADGVWLHKRIERDLKAIKDTANARAKAGKKGGKASGKSRQSKQNEASASTLVKQTGKQNEAELYLKGKNAVAVPIARAKLSKKEDELLKQRDLVYRLENECQEIAKEIEVSQ